MYNNIEHYIVDSLLDLMGLGPRSALDAPVHDIALLEYGTKVGALMRSISQRVQSEYPCAVHFTKPPYMPPTPLTAPMQYDVIMLTKRQYTPYFAINHMPPLLAANGCIIFNCHMRNVPKEIDMINSGGLELAVRFSGPFGVICIVCKNAK